VDESYKDGSGSEHGIYQTCKLALDLYAVQKISGTYCYGEENLLRTQGPDGGFHTGYDQAGTYAGTWENAETTSIAMIAISNLSITSPFPFPFRSSPDHHGESTCPSDSQSSPWALSSQLLSSSRGNANLLFRTTDDLSLLFLVERVQLTYFDMFVFSTGHSCEETGSR
jgi:hypothetical protein